MFYGSLYPMIFCEDTPTLLTVTLIPHQSNWYRNPILMVIRVKQAVNFTGYCLKRRTLHPLNNSGQILGFRTPQVCH